MGFFDKLTGVKTGEKKEEKKPNPPKAKASKRAGEKKKVEKPEVKSEIKEESKKITPPAETKTGGQLTIDVYETDGDFVIQSTIAGIKAEDLDISVEDELVTIRGTRQKTAEGEGKNYFYQECYWGEFSRQVILPEEVDGSRAEAAVKNGVLTLRIPKIRKVKKKKIVAKQEE